MRHIKPTRLNVCCPCLPACPASPPVPLLPPARARQIRRDINAESNSSTWRLNGRDARMKDVEELVRDKLKIQLDNLCQVGAAPAGWLAGCLGGLMGAAG